MSEGRSGKLQVALAECEPHAAVLERDRSLLPGHFGPELAAELPDDLRMVLDQAAFRFMKLQDALGEKVLPGLLDETLDPLPAQSPFAQKLQRLERLGAIPSAHEWRVLREVRNALAHDYPDNPALQAASINRFLKGLESLLQAWRWVRRYAQDPGLSPAG